MGETGKGRGRGGVVRTALSDENQASMSEHDTRGPHSPAVISLFFPRLFSTQQPGTGTQKAGKRRAPSMSLNVAKLLTFED